MKLIQLGSANDALCHFVSLGGYEMLLDCGASLELGEATRDALRVRLPALAAVDVASIDVILLSNHTSLLALPFLKHTLGFKGVVYATEMTLRFGRVLLEELHGSPSVLFEQPPVVGSLPTVLPPFTVAEITACMDDVTIVEFKEVTRLSYGVSMTALSSGFSLGSCVWLLESPSERVAYVAAASGDLNRHPKELDFAPLIDCDTLVITDIKPDRDPHATTDLTVERLLAAVSRVVDRGGVCILPCSFGGVMFDMLETIYATFMHHKMPALPMVLLSPAVDEVLDATQCGAEFLSEKMADKMYLGEPAFTHELLRKSKSLQVASTITKQLVSSLQHGGVVFVTHPALRLGLSSELVRAFGSDSRHAVVLTDPALDPHKVLSPFYSLPIEKMVCSIDARLSCGDVNQFIARCCPRSLIVPQEYLVATTSSSSAGGVKPEQKQVESSSHFSRVFPLHELIAARPKTELETFPMRLLEPIALDKSAKYIYGKLDPALAARAIMTEVNGKGVACISGRIAVKHQEFVVEAPERSSDAMRSLSTAAESFSHHNQKSEADGKARVTGAKRKAPASSSAPPPTLSPTGSVIIGHRVIEYREKSSILLGQVDEDKLLQQIKAYDAHLDVYISQGPNNADAMLSIPALDARVTLWREDAKTLIETPKEDARALLQKMVLAQLHVLPV